MATCSTGYGGISLYDGMECFLVKLKLLKTMIFSNIHPESLNTCFWFLYLLYIFSVHLITITYHYFDRSLKLCNTKYVLKRL